MAELGDRGELGAGGEAGVDGDAHLGEARLAALDEVLQVAGGALHDLVEEERSLARPPPRAEGSSGLRL